MQRFLLAAAVVVVASAAHAQNDVGKARQLFEKGAALAAEGRWSDALVQFDESARLRPHAITSYNIGYCERALGQATRARKHFAQALAQDSAKGGTELTPDLRAATTKYLEEIKAEIATPQLTIDPPDAAVSIDGRPLEQDGERMLAGTRVAGPGEKVPRSTFILEVDAGPHEIVAVTADGRSKVVHEYFPPGSTKSVRVEVPKPVTRVIETPSTRGTFGLVLGGIGLAAIGVGTYFGFAAHATWNDAKNACPLRTTCPDDEGARLSSSARRQANASTIAFVAGGAALFGGAVLYITAPKGRSTTVGATPLPGGGFVNVAASF